VLPTTVDCEILIFDDGSTDNTPELVRAYADGDPRIRYIQRPTNVGMMANFEGMKEARGEFVTLLADDDSVELGNYERKVALLDTNPHIGFVYSLVYAADENLVSRQVIRRAEYLDHSYIGGRDEFTDLMSGNYIPANSVVFRRSLMDERGAMDRNLTPAAIPFCDWDMWLRYAFRTETAFINEPMVRARFHGGSMGQASTTLTWGQIDVWRTWLVDRPEPPALDKRTWERMHAVFVAEVQRLHADDPVQSQACLAAFERLRQDALANASLAFASRTRCITTGPESPTRASLVWTGPVWNMGGMASDLRGLAAAAEPCAKLSVRLEDLTWGLPVAELTTDERLLRLSESVGRRYPAAHDHVHVWHGPLEYFRPDENARARVARVAFGSGTPSPNMLEIAADVQALWLPSQFQCDVLAERGIPREKLRVLPGCVDVGNDVVAEAGDTGTGRHFNFTSMVQFEDPGFEVLVRAFAREFRADEDVALVVVVRMPANKTNEQLINEVQHMIQRELGPVQRELASINFRVGVQAQETLATLLGASQTYVEPRPTTWGRGVLEAMATGVPVVGAQIGPNLELLSPDNSFAMASEATPESIGQLMRQAFSDPDETHRRGLRARADVAATHSVATVGARLRELVDELHTQSAG
jgi:glycosyltransferase involved in cell wall biosynthesis